MNELIDSIDETDGIDDFYQYDALIALADVLPDSPTDFTIDSITLTLAD